MIHVQSNQLFLNREPNSRWQKIYLFPLSRILIAILFLLPVTQIQNLFSILVLDDMEGVTLLVTQSIKVVVFITLLAYSYSLYTKYIEKRKAFEFSKKDWYKEFGMGILIGGGMVILIVIILLLTNSYAIERINSPQILLSRLFRYAQGSFIEDLLFTIIVFRLLEEFSGTLLSYIAVALLFGGMHLMNDNATVANSLFLSIQNIVLFAPFILTRRMWMGWAVHFSWNYFQTGIFGMNNSGMNHDGFITPIISGPEWLTGGSFGIEGSWISLIINLAVGIPILVYAIKEGQTVGFWSKRNKHNA